MRFVELFAWWTGSSLGQSFTLWRTGATFVGEDEFGNKYYRAKNWPPHGERRYVVYNGDWDASKVPPMWRGWLTHTFAEAPSEQAPLRRDWQKPFVQNLTGTPGAYRPPGSTLATGRRPEATGDYDAWSPER
jgi:NADH:ubiquinone oxidoreductase subunit